MSAQEQSGRVRTPSFRQEMIEAFQEKGLDLEETKGLVGADLASADINNAGLRQLWDALENLHAKFANKKRKHSEETSEPTPPVATGAVAASRKVKAAKRKYNRKMDENGVPIKRDASSYCIFTAAVTAANKGQTDGWDKISVLVADLEGLSEDIMARVAHLKGTEHTMAELLKIGQKIIAEIDAKGKVHPMKLAPFLWFAVGKKNPFPVAGNESMDEEATQAPARAESPSLLDMDTPPIAQAPARAESPSLLDTQYSQASWDASPPWDDDDF